MAQFRVYRNPRADSRSRYPLLLDVQTDLLESLGTRVVVPLGVSKASTARPISILMPALEVEGRRYVMCTPQLAGVRQADIGPEVADLSAHRGEIIAALDMLVSGF